MTHTSAPPAGDGLVESLIMLLARGAWWVISRPTIFGAAALGAGLWWLGGWGTVIYGFCAVVAVLVVWFLFAEASFHRVVAGPWGRSRARRRYRRLWPIASEMCGLVKRRNEVSIVPRLFRVEIGGVTDRLQVGMVLGQSAADYERVCPELASSFGALTARVVVPRPGLVWIVLVRADALAAVVPALPVPHAPQLAAVPIGVREDGAPWLLPLLGTHIFVGGVSGSGKGSVLWSTLRALAAAIRDGLVTVWAVDPKGGMELGFGRPLFARFACKSTFAMVELLEEAVTVMDRRCARLAGQTRLHTPTPDDPMVLVVVDELSTLTAYEPDVKLRNRATAAISGLLARGRAAGLVVIAAAQDPRKEVVSFRSLFPTKIALRLDTPTQVDMVLGDGMHAMGAAADRVAAGTPGVGYVTVEGIREPVRVRAAYVSDAEIRAQAAEFPAPTSDLDANPVPDRGEA